MAPNNQMEKMSLTKIILSYFAKKGKQNYIKSKLIVESLSNYLVIGQKNN